MTTDLWKQFRMARTGEHFQRRRSQKSEEVPGIITYYGRENGSHVAFGFPYLLEL